MIDAASARIDERIAMVRAIDAEWDALPRGIPLPALSAPLREALLTVPRHRFVPAALTDHAYADAPLPIGDGQTISQPFVVALMTALLDPGADEDILEVGTGSGYQAAVLSRLARQVYSIECVDTLAQAAAARLAALGYDNVTVRSGDGHEGWPEHAPYAGIIVTAAAAQVPPALLEQLAPGGRLVAPVGPHGGVQSLQVIDKDARGDERRRDIIAVAFVPLVHRSAGASQGSGPTTEIRDD